MSKLRGEERLVTVVFADMTESVRRTSCLDAEQATGLVNPLLETMVELMTRYGGRIDRFLGDGVLAVFGVPSAHEDDPIRAVRAALDLRERAAELGLPVTVGVNTGRVYFGPVGSDLHEELTVMGPIVNLAARFQAAASSGEIVIGAPTQGHVRAAFSLAPVSLTVKGLIEQVEAFKVERLLDHPDKVRGIEALKAEIVGRDTEIERLRGAYSQGDAVALVGLAGVGKSRLAAELRVSTSTDGGKWFEGRCLDITREMPYQPFQDLLRRQLTSTDLLPALRDSLRDLAVAKAMTPERAAEIEPFLAYMLGLELGDKRDLAVRESEPELRHALTVDAVIAYLTSWSRLQPVVVFLDDIHWADQLSLGIVRRIRTIDQPNIMLLLASRPPTDDWQAQMDPRIGQVTLRELDRTQSQTLVTSLLERSGIPSSLEAQILDQAQGNPFYVEELIRSLIQRGAISRHDGQWRVNGEDVRLELPPSVEGVLMARFDRLPPMARRAARAASVLGRTFAEAQFTALAGPDLVAELTGLVGAGILIPDGMESYSFVHALTREAVYSSLLPSHQAELHERVARDLEDQPHPDLDQIAHHYQHSRNHHKAVEYLCKAGEHALESFNTDAARRYLNDGIERLDQLSEPEQPAWRGRLQARLGELLVRMAQHQSARAALQNALAEMEPDSLETARVWRLLGQACRLEDNPEEAHRCYDHAEEALSQAGDSREEKRAWIEVQKERSFALYFGGRGQELADHNRRVEPVVEHHGSAAQRADFLVGRLLHTFVEHRFLIPPDTVTMARNALSLAEEGADPGRVAECRFVLGFSLLWADEYEEAAAVLADAVVANERVGAVTDLCRARAYLAIALRRLRRVDEAERAASDALEAATQLDDTYYAGHALAVQCWVEWKRESGDCDYVGAEAYEAWGRHEGDGKEGLNCEFSWLAVWPRAADAHLRGETAAALDHLRLLQVPWERPLPPDLQSGLDEVVTSGGPQRLIELLRLARKHAYL